MKRSLTGWIMAAFFLAGCATAPTAIEKREVATQAVKAVEETPIAPAQIFEDRELLLDGVALLRLSERSEQAAARSIFISLIQRFPQSRWRPVAEACIRLIDERDLLREEQSRDRQWIDQAQAEKAKALQENDGLKKAIRDLTDKRQLETAAFAKENDQLKKDIQRLKALEIELEKRERMLR